MAAFVVFTIQHPQVHVEALLMYLDAGAFALATSLSLSLCISRYCGLRSFGELQAWPNFFRQIPFFVHVGRNGIARANVFVDAAETIVRDCGQKICPVRNCGIVSGENAFGAIAVQGGQALVESVLTWDVEKMPQLSIIASPSLAPFHG